MICPTVLKEVPTCVEQILAAFSFTLLSDSSQTFSAGFKSDDCGPPGQLMLHSITLLLSQIVFIEPEGVFFGQCPVEKQVISANRMGWCVAVGCGGSHAGKMYLEF